eukprot:TRINITY_DN2181_c0_g1_i2.p1 TRINITY_DN2181_c0_g1~~TRINITY_DN2181_c0_g1_i2.p1  ORF type:complete len:769 (+),score=147.27 TRINITY_DN2181_c0_g1_i2:1067-3373(+)
MVVGNFELDYRDGEIRMKTSLPSAGDSVKSSMVALSNVGPMFGEMLKRHLSSLTEYANDINKMLLAETPPTTPQPNGADKQSQPTPPAPKGNAFEQSLNWLKTNNYTATKTTSVLGSEVYTVTGPNLINPWEMVLSTTVTGRNTSLALYSRYPKKATAEMMDNVNAVINTINCSVMVGNFEIDYRDGEVRFKTTLLTERSGEGGGCMSNAGAMFGEMVRRHLSSLGSHCNKIVDALSGNESAISKPPPNVKEALIEYLKSNTGWATSVSKNQRQQDVIKISGPGIDENWPLSATLIPGKSYSQVIIRSRCLLHASAGRISTVSEVVTNYNSKMVVGNFEFDYNDGEVCMKTTLITDTGGTSGFHTLDNLGKMFGQSVERHLASLAKYDTEIVKSINGVETADNLSGSTGFAAKKPIIKEDESLSPNPNSKNKAGLTPNPVNPANNVKEKPQKQDKDQNVPPKKQEVNTNEERPTPGPPPVNNNFNIGVDIIPSSQIVYTKDPTGKRVELGSGGFATVYSARLHGSLVAVKEIKEKMDEKVKNDFTNEVSVMARLRHPNIVMLLGMVEEPPSIILPLMEKGSLDSVMKRESGKIGWQTKIKFFLEAARGLAFIHGHNVIHGDLKPQNILVDENNVVHISDFGLSKTKSSATMHASTTVPGFSLYFAAPEVFATGKMSPASDVYSFGIILWNVTAERPPYEDQIIHPFQMMLQVQLGTRPKISTLPKSTPEEFKNLIVKCWDPTPNNRPTFLEVLETLEQIHQSRFWERV